MAEAELTWDTPLVERKPASPLMRRTKPGSILASGPSKTLRTLSDSQTHCGSNRMQSRGHRRTKTFKIQRLQCRDCGSWQSGKRTKVSD